MILLALITAAQFREHYPGLTGTGEDTLLGTLITRADALLAAECGYPDYDGLGTYTLEDQTYTLRISGPSLRDPRALCLCVRPIVSVTSVKLDDTGFFSGSETTLASGTDYVSDLASGILLRADGYTWPVGLQGIRVVCVAGYATTPPGLAAIAAAQVRHLWDLRNVSGQQSYSIGGDSATLVDADSLIPASVRAALGPYRVCA